MLLTQIFLQVEELTSLITTKDISITGIILVIAWYGYKKLQDNDKDIKELRIEKDAGIKELREEKDKEIKELNFKIIDIQGNALKEVSDFSKVIEDNTKAMESHGRLIEKLFDKIDRH